MKKILLALFSVTLFISGPLTTSNASPVANPGITSDQVLVSVQKQLKARGYATPTDGLYGARTVAAIKTWQKANGFKVTGLVNPATLKSLGLDSNGILIAATATTVATRIDPPVAVVSVPTGLNGLPFAPGGMDLCAEMTFYRVQWNLPAVFDSIGYRESRCQNDAKSTTVIGVCCRGYWANYMRSHLSTQSAYRNGIINICQVTSEADMYGTSPLQKQKSACVTAIVYNISGLSPWAL